MLKGDRLTGYFIAIANGRRRRCLINRLIIDGNVVEDPIIIKVHIFSFFSSLLSAKPSVAVSISPSLWCSSSVVTEEENLGLLASLSCEEIDATVLASNANSAPDLDVFSNALFHKFWAVLSILFTLSSKVFVWLWWIYLV